MARKRLNTKFLTIAGIATGVILIIAVAAAVVGKDAYRRLKWMVRGTPTEHAEKARALYTANKFEDAGEEFKRAMQLKGAPDAQIYTELGDCYSHMALADRENLIKAKMCWDQAVAIDQTYVPAMTRILELVEADAERAGRSTQAAERWEAVRTAAARLLNVEPENSAAKISYNRAILQRSALGIDVGQTQVDESIKTLLAEGDKNGKVNAEALFYGMSAMMQRAVDRIKVNDRPGANAICADVRKILEGALAAYPQDAMLHFRAAAAYRMLGVLEIADSQKPKYQDRVKEEFEKAAGLAKPTDSDYIEMKLNWGKMLEGNSDQAGAEKIYRALIAEVPADMSVRVAYAELLSRNPERRREAIDLLEKAPAPDPAKVAGMQAWIVRERESYALFTLLNVKLDMMSLVKGKPEAEKFLTEAGDIFTRLSANPGMADSPMGLQARGRLELARGQNLQAKQTLERALTLLPETPTTPAEADQLFRLMFMLAGADLATDQTGHAKQLLTRLVSVDPKFVPTRLMLAQILIREKNMSDAQPHVDELMNLVPDNPAVKRLKIFTLDPEKDKQQITTLLAKLPDATRDDIIEKAQMVVFAGRKDEAIKLFERARSMDVNDLNVIVALARLYNDTGDKEKATQLLDDAIAKNPDKPELKLVQAQMNGSDSEGVVELRKEMIDKIQDPLRRELAYHDLSVQQGNQEEAIQHLARAVQMNPNDDRVLDLEFRYALIGKDWNKASEFLEKLAASNKDQAGGLLYRVRLSLARGDLKSASDQAQQLTQKMPEFAQSWVVAGQVQRAQSKFADALTSFDLALQKQPGNLDAIRGAIDVSYALKDTSRARQYITQGRNMRPDLNLFKEAELQWELTYGDPNKVIAPREENLKKAIDNHDPNEQQAWAALGTAYSAVAGTKDPSKDAAAIRQLTEKARDTYKAAAAKFPDEIGFVKLYVDMLVQLKDQATAEKAIATLAARPNWQNKPEPVVLLASVYARMNDQAKQEKTLRDYIATSPQSVPVQVQLSSLLARQNKLDEALKLLDSNADDPTIRRQRIELQVNAGRLTEAEKEINAALAATSSPTPFLLIRQANVLMQSGRATQALSVLENVLSQMPNNAEALFYRAQIYVASKRNLQQAIGDLKDIREVPGTELQVRGLLAEAYHYAGDDDASIRELEDAITAFPTEKGPRMRLLARYREYNPPRWSQAERLLQKTRSMPVFEKDVDFATAEASMWLDRKDPAKANEVLAQAAKVAPNDMNIFRLSCEVIFQAKQYKQLIARTDAMVKAKNAPWWVYQYRGRAKKADTGDRGAALDELTAGLQVASDAKDDAAVGYLVQTVVDEVGPEQAIARLYDRAKGGDNRWRIMLASVMQSNNDITGAIGWVEQVMSDSNAKPEELNTARTMAGILYMQLNPPEVGKAVDAYRKILAQNPDDIIALNNLASTMILPNSGFAAKDALPYSEKAYNQLQARGDVNPYIFDTQGYMLILLGRVDEGIAILQKAIDKEAIPEACYHMGEALIAKGPSRQADAEESLKQAAALLDAAVKDKKPIDKELKGKIDNALERAKQLAAAKS